MTKILKPQFLMANVDTDVPIRRETLDEVEHLVIPVIAAKEMVMNGLFYPASEFKDWAETWNGVPVPVNHPKFQGMPISAKSPRIHELNNIGTFYNVTFTSDNKLKGEIWVNLTKAEKLGHMDLVNRFENGEVVEVSTGLFSNVEETPGSFNGEPYVGIIRHIRPDHLALLPNDVGACSVKDGCGAMVNNCGCSEPKTNKEKVKNAFSLIGKFFGLNMHTDSHRDIMRKIEIALESKHRKEQFVFIMDIFENEVVYGVSDDHSHDKLFKRSFNINGDQAQLGDDTLEVIRKTNYVPVISDNGLIINEEGNQMEKNELIQKVIANKGNGFSDENKTELEALTEDMLGKMVSNEEAESSEDSSSEDAGKDEAPVEPQTPEQKVNTVLENIEDPDTKEFMENSVSEHKEKKQALVNEIVKKSEFTPEEVKAFSYNQLQKLAKSFKVADYRGRTPNLNEPDNKAYPQPSINDLGSKRKEDK